MKTMSLSLCLLVTLSATTWAGNWHAAGSLQCGDCHLQHSSDSRNPTTEGPYSILLKKNSINELCLSCHDGTNATSPDVLDPVVMYNSTPSQASAAGFFITLAVANQHGHSLGVPTIVPLQGASRSMELNCSSCHASHGNGNYRNLVEDPAGTGASISVVEGVNVYEKVAPDNPPTAGGSTVAFSRDNIGYASGLSAWCSACHDQLATNNTATTPAHFNSHPSSVALNAFPAPGHTDAAHWVSGTGEGFAGVGGIPRIPFQAPTATTFVTATTPQMTNEVSCMSCHKGHGSSNAKGLLWPYLEGGDASLSACQQCHNK